MTMFPGKVALVTGARSGLGEATAWRFAQEGAKVVVAARRADQGARVVQRIVAAGGEAHFVQADVGDAEDCARLMAMAVATLGGVNALCNSAATTERGTLLDTTLAMWQQQMDINARGPFLLMQALVRHLLEHQLPGSIVNILSQSAHCGQSFLVPYSASKATLANLTKNVAQSWRAQRIRCNGVMAG